MTKSTTTISLCFLKQIFKSENEGMVERMIDIASVHNHAEGHNYDSMAYLWHYDTMAYL